MADFEGYGKSGSLLGHDIIIMEHHEPNKSKRRMCRCGCRKKQTHIQFCNGVAMNGGCEESMNDLKERADKTKARLKQKRSDLYKKFGLKEN
ncbi:MAG: hypothetical protein JKX96_01060 [Acinetobacter sp.]|nr:hypothetical protein [Acinetobacter sp.]